MAALLHPYTDAWPRSFALIAETLRAAIGAPDLQIHHIGSTAVPGLPAKPIIDIDVVLPEHMDLTTLAAHLARIGYTHHGDQGIPAREVFKRLHREVIILCSTRCRTTCTFVRLPARNWIVICGFVTPCANTAGRGRNTQP